MTTNKLSVLTIVVVTTILFTSCQKVIGIEETQTLPVTPYSPLNATKKSNLIQYLNHLTNCDSTIIGQHIGDIGSPYFDYAYISALTNKYGKTPGLLGVNLGWDDCSRDYSSYISYIDNFCNQGGLVTLNTSFPNPSNMKDLGSLEIVDYQKLLKEGNPINKHFKIILNNIGNVLQQLKDKNVIVLWRPFHEMNGGWSWYGNINHWATTEEFKSMWIYMYDYFYHERQLDNLVWVYSPNYQNSRYEKDVLYYYPGSNYVDVAGLDYYQDNLDNLNDHNSFEMIKSLNKPVVIAEIGPSTKKDGSFNNNIYSGLTKKEIAYFMVWSSWKSTKISLNNCQNTDSLFNNPLMLTQDEIHY